MKNDIESFPKNDINISKIGAENKFISDEIFYLLQDLEKGPGFIHFTHSGLECEKLTPQKRMDAIHRMDKYLQKHIESEVEKIIENHELIRLKEYINTLIFDEKKKIRNKLREQHHCFKYAKRYEEISKQDSSEDSSFSYVAFY